MTAAVLTWRQRLGLGDAYPLHAPTDVERAMVAEIAELRQVPTATHGPLHLTNRKTADIVGRGYNIVGYVLRRADGEEVSISAESAVRWLPKPSYSKLMHEQVDNVGRTQWSHDLQARLTAASEDQDDMARNLMAEAACLLAALTSHPGSSDARG